MAQYTARDIDGLPGEYMFNVDDRNVTIPGFGGGPDGPMNPDRPEQEAWMRARSGLNEVWYLTWELPTPAAREAFLALIGVT